jgi:hypothetical protein
MFLKLLIMQFPQVNREQGSYHPKQLLFETQNILLPFYE